MIYKSLMIVCTTKPKEYWIINWPFTRNANLQLNQVQRTYYPATFTAAIVVKRCARLLMITIIKRLTAQSTGTAERDTFAPDERFHVQNAKVRAHLPLNKLIYMLLTI